MIVNVVLENKTRVLDRLFSYSVPKELVSSVKRGCRVIVPFGRGNSKKLGLIVEITDNPLVDVKLKDIYKLIDYEPLISEELIDLALFMRDRYLSDLSSAFQRVLPPGNWKDLEKLIYLNKEVDDKDISEFFSIPKEFKTAVKRFDENTIENLIRKGILKEKYDIKGRIKPNLVEYHKMHKQAIGY